MMLFEPANQPQPAQNPARAHLYFDRLGFVGERHDFFVGAPVRNLQVLHGVQESAEVLLPLDEELLQHVRLAQHARVRLLHRLHNHLNPVLRRGSCVSPKEYDVRISDVFDSRTRGL
jgi:hypothetical protein